MHRYTNYVQKPNLADFKLKLLTLYTLLVNISYLCRYNFNI